MRKISLLSVAALVATVLAGPLLTTSAHAAPTSVRVTLKVSTQDPVVGQKVTYRGKVAGRSVGARVVLQRRTSDGWVKVRAKRVKAGKKYVFTAPAREGRTRYRVRVNRTQKIARSFSRVVAVRGVAPAAPTPVPTPAPEPTPTPEPVPDGEVAVEVQRILADTNAFRAREGKAPLALDLAMTEVARDWSQRMADTGVFAHNPDYSTQIPSGWTRAGENIAAGQSVESVVQAWINSSGHRANLLGDYTHIGIGYVSKSSTPYNRYYTQVFANYPSR